MSERRPIPLDIPIDPALRTDPEAMGYIQQAFDTDSELLTPVRSEPIAARAAEPGTTQAVEKPEKKVESWKERFERRHRMGVVGIRIEEALEQGKTREEVRNTCPELAQLPDKARELFEDAILDYTYARELAEAQEQKLLKVLDAEQLDLWGRGEKYYRALIKEAPIGRVSFRRNDAFFVVECENETDYVRVGSLPKSNGVFKHEAFIILHFYDDSGIKRPRFKTEVIPVIIAHVPTGMFAEKQEQIFIHERQHFINHDILSRFVPHEIPHTVGESPRVEETRRVMAPFRMLKDEVLACLRDGRSGEALAQTLAHKLYKHLFDDLPAESQPVAMEEIRRIGEAFQRLPRPIRERPDLIVHQLYDIPLHDITPYLHVMRRSYERVLRSMVQQENIIASFEQQLAERVYPSVAGPLIHTAHRQMRVVRHAIQYEAELALGIVSPGKQPPIMPVRMDMVQKAFSRLERHGVELPYARDPEVISIRPRVRDSNVMKTLERYISEIADTNRQKLIDAFVDLTDQQRDEMHAYLQSEVVDFQEIPTVFRQITEKLERFVALEEDAIGYTVDPDAIRLTIRYTVPVEMRKVVVSQPVVIPIRPTQK